MIDGFFSDKEIDGNYLKYFTCNKIERRYISYDNFLLGNGAVYLYVKELPSFEKIFDYFMSCTTPFLKINKKQDISLSLLYNPYFDKLYETLKFGQIKLSKNRSKFLRKYLLEDLADPMFYQVIMFPGMPEDYQKYYLEQKILSKSQELLQLFKK